jgi:hypothetical protein
MEMQTEVVAREFSRILASQLTAAEMAEVISRNARPDYADTNSCASHDFCDANMVMDEAFNNLGIAVPYGENWDTPQRAQSVALWNAAWDLAKAHNFYLGVR